MVDSNTVAIGVAAGVASEAFGVTDVTPIGRQGDGGQPGGGNGGIPPGVAELLANARGAGDAIQQGVDTGENVTDAIGELANFSQSLQQGSETLEERVTEIYRTIPAAAEEGGGGIVTGVEDYTDEQTGGGSGPAPIPNNERSGVLGSSEVGLLEGVNQGVENLERNAENFGENLGRGIAAGPFGVAGGFVDRTVEGFTQSYETGEQIGAGILQGAAGDDERLATTQEVMRGEASIGDATFGPVNWIATGEAPDISLPDSLQNAADALRENTGSGPIGPRQAGGRSSRDRDRDNNTGRDASRGDVRRARDDDEAMAGGDPARDPSDEVTTADRYGQELGGLR